MHEKFIEYLIKKIKNLLSMIYDLILVYFITIADIEFINNTI